MKAKLLYALLALWIFGLVLLYGYHQSGLGNPIYMLRTTQVDPRDYFRGDYMILNYEISTLPDQYKDGELPDGLVYVSLKRDGDFWVISEVTDWEPNDGPYLQGQLKGRRILYDLEKYFVPEGKGGANGKLTVAVALRPDGRAQIKQLYQNGMPWP